MYLRSFLKMKDKVIAHYLLLFFPLPLKLEVILEK